MFNNSSHEDYRQLMLNTLQNEESNAHKPFLSQLKQFMNVHNNKEIMEIHKTHDFQPKQTRGTHCLKLE